MMRVLEITPSGSNKYEEMFRPYLYRQIGMEGFVSLGLWDEENPEEPLGVAQFFMNYHPSLKKKPRASLTWFLIRQDMRGRGIGAFFMGECKRILREKKCVNIHIEWTMDFKDGAEEFLQSQGFFVKKGKSRGVVISAGEAEQKAALQGPVKNRTLSFAKASEKWMREAAKVFPELLSLVEFREKEKQLEKTGEGGEGAMASAGLIEWDCSCLCIVQEKVRGYYLIRQLSPRFLETYRMKSTLGTSPQVILDMLRESLLNMSFKYSPDTMIYLPCRNKYAKTLITDFFPGLMNEYCIIADYYYGVRPKKYLKLPHQKILEAIHGEEGEMIKKALNKVMRDKAAVNET
ncbi:MAG: GNAT family N-acetyltransferase [Lachnospiraceae bacterium]|nr:GNAT family N-acetyltransferase [Lachnospiraceae bacterium]